MHFSVNFQARLRVLPKTAAHQLRIDKLMKHHKFSAVVDNMNCTYIPISSKLLNLNLSFLSINYILTKRVF